MSKATPKQIVILGGGYGGMMTAIRLAGQAKRQPIQITLVNGSEHFIERIRLHENATNHAPKQASIPHLLRGTGVTFIQGWVTQLDPTKRAVCVKMDAGDQTLNYDFLVYALGSRVDMESVPGVSDYAFALNAYGGRSAVELAQCLEGLGDSNGKVVVVGGGATGIEGATEMKSRYPKLNISLVTQGAFGTFKNDKRIENYMRKSLTRQNIAIHEYQPVVEVQQNMLVLENGETMPFDLCLWAGGFSATPLAKDAGLQVNKRHQILVDPYLRSQSHTNIFAIGDACLPTEKTGAPLRMSVFVAMVMGAHTADTLNRILRGKSPRPFSYSTYGQGVALGQNDAIGFMTFPNDHRTGPLFTGKFAVSFRNFFVWFLFYSLRIERRFPGFFLWLGKRRVKMASYTAPSYQVEKQV